MSDEPEFQAAEHSDLPVEPRGSATREEELPDDGVRVEAATELLAELRGERPADEQLTEEARGEASHRRADSDAEPN